MPGLLAWTLSPLSESMATRFWPEILPRRCQWRCCFKNQRYLALRPKASEFHCPARMPGRSKLSTHDRLHLLRRGAGPRPSLRHDCVLCNFLSETIPSTWLSRPLAFLDLSSQPTGRRGPKPRPPHDDLLQHLIDGTNGPHWTPLSHPQSRVVYPSPIPVFIHAHTM